MIGGGELSARRNRLVRPVEHRAGVGPAQRYVADRSGRSYSGHFLNALDQPVVKQGRLNGRDCIGIGQAYAGGKDVFGLEAEPDVHQMVERAEQQARARQQHERQRDLGNNQRVAQAAAG